MFFLRADKNEITVQCRETLTSGSMNVYPVRFEFSSDWDGLERVGVFTAGQETRSVALGPDNQCTIPWEVLEKPGVRLLGGVCGKREGEIVLPTVWADLGCIRSGAVPGEESRRPTPDLWEQALGRKGDSLSYDGLSLSLLSGDKKLSTVRITGGGGTTDHQALSNRGAAEQHPIDAISGLKTELDRIPEPVEALTNFELEEILK